MAHELDTVSDDRNDIPDFRVDGLKQAYHFAAPGFPECGRVVHDDLDHGLEVVVKIKLRTRERERDDFCAVYQIPRVADQTVWLDPSDIDSHVTKRALCDLSKRHAQETVFVDVIQVSEHRQNGWRFRMRPAVVRLQLLNSVPDSLRREANAMPLTSEVVSSVAYGKASVSSDAGRDRVVYRGGDTVNKVIEDASVVVNGVTENQTPKRDVWRFIDPNANADAGGIVVVLWDESVGIAVFPGNDQLLDGISVFRRPL